jgi:hypothetical protein
VARLPENKQAVGRLHLVLICNPSQSRVNGRTRNGSLWTPEAEELEFVADLSGEKTMKVVAEQDKKAAATRGLSAAEEEALKLLRESARESSRAATKPPLRPDRRNRYVLGPQ